MSGYFFEDFYVGQKLRHATPRTITSGDTSCYGTLYGMRYAVQSARTIAQQFGHQDTPIDEWLIFNIIFGKTVTDISYNAIANLGYAEGIFYRPLYSGATVYAESEVIGLKQNSSGKNGIVYVKSKGFDEDKNDIFSYIRWVMVRKSNLQARAPETHIPEFEAAIKAEDLRYKLPRPITPTESYILGSKLFYHDYNIGDVIIHPFGQTIEEAEHMLATRLYQNSAKVHFDERFQQQNNIAKRIVYGGHVISTVRSICYDGLQNLLHIAALNSGVHSAPLFAGDTVYAYSRITGKSDECIAGENWGALRLQSIGLKNIEPREYLNLADKNEHKDKVILKLDYWGYMPKAQRSADQQYTTAV